MPVSALSFSEVNQCRTKKDASASHISTASSSDGGTGVLLFGRKSEKRRNSTGLNVRLSRMLMRVNTSYASDLMAPGGKRSRNPSNCSSSSTVVSEATETPIDSIHTALKSNSLGDEFAIIKAGSSPDKARLGFVQNTDVPSWRDTDKEPGEKRAKSQRELPSWLSETFSSLEPDHPLRSLARNTCSKTSYDDEATSSRKEDIAENYLPEETHEDPIFAFAPPTANTALPEAASSTTDVEEHAFGQYVDVESACGVANDGRPLTVPVVEPYDYDLSAGAVVVAHDEAQDLPEGFVPFSQPGPFSRKTVHFMTPVRSSPLSLSNPASNQSWNQPTLSSTTYPNQHPSGNKPYSTPGPAAHFSLASSHHATRDRMPISDQDYSSDSLTLAYEAQAEDNVFAHSFNPSIERSQEKPFSAPGPAFCVQSTRYFSSPNEDHLFDSAAEQAYDDNELKEVEPLPLYEPDKAESIHFIAPEHAEISSDRQKLTSVMSLNAATTSEETSPVDAPFVEETEPIIDYMDAAHHALEHAAEPPVFTPAEPESEPELSAPPIELFSSPPYIRFTRNFEEDSNEARTDSRSRAPRFKRSSTARTRSRSRRNVYDQEARTAVAVHGVSSPYMRLDRLPSPAGGRDAGGLGDIVPASPHTPQSQPYQARAHIASDLRRDLTGDPRVLTSATTDISRYTGAEAEEELMEGKLVLEPEPEPEVPNPRRAFAPAPGIYLSPLRESGDRGLKAGQNNEANSKRTNDGGLWNTRLSQETDDSIENWEA